MLALREGVEREGRQAVGRDLDRVAPAQPRCVRADLGVQVVELPLELPGQGADLRLRVGRGGVDGVEGLPRHDEEEDDDERGDDRPDELGDVVAVDLGRQGVVAGLAPVADDRPDDQRLDDQEDRHRDEEDDGVQVADLRALGRHRDRRVESGEELLALVEDVHAEVQQDQAEADDRGADSDGEDRSLRGARSLGARHQGPRGWAASLDGARRPMS